MKILMVNKFLYPKGGSETYVLKLGEYLAAAGHQVQYFGMEDERNTVGNDAGAYTSNMEFHSGSLWKKLTYSLRTIYSGEARRKLRQVLERFQPEVCHLNNFNYQLTPSILLEIRSWERESGRNVRIVYTAHDYQLVCPNHMCRNPGSGENCEKCLRGSRLSCIRGRCIHGSAAKSAVGAAEAFFWRRMGVYRQLDRIICCSRFMKEKLDTDPVLAEKTVVLHNFVEKVPEPAAEKKDYVLYFGRYSREKGIAALCRAARALPEIPFVFAGSGPEEHLLEGIPNIRNVGFQSGETLKTWIREARFTVCPSVCYENCPMSVLESMTCGTPVLGAEIGGIPELISGGENGELFESGNAERLIQAIERLWKDPALLERYGQACARASFDTPEAYGQKLLRIYEMQ